MNCRKMKDEQTCSHHGEEVAYLLQSVAILFNRTVYNFKVVVGIIPFPPKLNKNYLYETLILTNNL